MRKSTFCEGGGGIMHCTPPGRSLGRNDPRKSHNVTVDSLILSPTARVEGHMRVIQFPPVKAFVKHYN